jgi:spore cortex formation protein SpoVR/YcgB (stage V sporulation)
MTDTSSKLLPGGSEWTPEKLEIYHAEIERIANDYMKLDYYPNQIEIISSEQMLDAYSAVGMPVMYNHWSFGKQFVGNKRQYDAGRMGLAYEIVINSSPCIAYCMEENTMMMQALVIAHASFGHNSFFKNNYLFKQWTDAEGIIDYLVYAKRYIAQCEERYGFEEVETLLDSCHALQNYGVDRYKRAGKLSAEQEEARQKDREEYLQSQLNELWSTIPTGKPSETVAAEAERFPKEPHENILYFVEKNAPMMKPWQREIVRIVRKISQYFYPQRQTQLMNEGWATFTHYTLINRMYDEGLVDDGFMLGFFESHSGVVAQPGFDHPYFGGINVYALGFAMFKDIKRICMEPTDEDREWFPDWAGNGDWLTTCTDAMKNFKDESFVMQFLSPKVIRDFKLFAVLDDDRDDAMEVSGIHNKQGYRKVREVLADNYRLASNEPNIQVYNVDLAGDRSITLQHVMHERRPLAEENTAEVMKHLRRLWGFDVVLESVDIDGTIQSRFKLSETESVLDVFVE